MTKGDYHKKINVNALSNDAVGKINQVDKWGAKNVKGNVEKAGDKFTVDFGETYVDFQITELIPGKKVVWKVVDCNLHWLTNKKEWNNTEVVFNISQRKNITQIDFTHIGLTPGFECYADCITGWNEHIGESLVNFINEGEGTPV